MFIFDEIFVKSNDLFQTIFTLTIFFASLCFHEILHDFASKNTALNSYSKPYDNAKYLSKSVPVTRCEKTRIYSYRKNISSNHSIVFFPGLVSHINKGVRQSNENTISVFTD